MTEQVKRQIELLAAEGMALQFVLLTFFQRLGEADPSVRSVIMQAFDDAANNAENFSIRAGAAAGHLPETLRIIEQMRLMFVGKDQPKREI